MAFFGLTFWTCKNIFQEKSIPMSLLIIGFVVMFAILGFFPFYFILAKAHHFVVLLILLYVNIFIGYHNPKIRVKRNLFLFY